MFLTYEIVHNVPGKRILHEYGHGSHTITDWRQFVIHSFIHSQFISVNLVYKDMENVMFIILGVTKHIYKENNNYKQ